ncbi:MAG: prepilin-type N-terminal cleavage/methylation domain-containing protein [Verrucomicrobiota bacterium]
MNYSRRNQRGFTLLEMTLAIFIIALISGSIFVIIQGVMSIAQQVDYGWNRHQQIYRFSEMLRRTFRELPPNASLISQDEKWNGKIAPTLILRGMPLDLGRETSLDGQWETVFQARELRGGRVSVYLHQRPVPGSRTEQDFIETEPIEIVPDLIYANWEFRQANSQDWIAVWNAGSRPALIRLEIIPLETEESQFFTFWVPGSGATNGNVGASGWIPR